MIEPGQTELLGHIAGRFKALGEVSRLRLLLVLRTGPQSVSALTQRLGMAQAGVSKHLGVLRGAGLVESVRQKNQIIYRVADERVFDMCAVVCDGVFKQIKSQQVLLAAMPPAGGAEEQARSIPMTVASIQMISVKEAAACDPATIDLIDVRTPGEFEAVHAVGARLVPLDRLDPKAVASGKPIYILCKSGKRAKTAAEKFIAAGIEEVAVIEGGTEAWVAVGLPVVLGKGVISLERQVRIAAGLLVLTGAVLAFTVHPWFVGLSAFVGAGLTFAGITDTCGMAMVLGRMPWNQGTTCRK